MSTHPSIVVLSPAESMVYTAAFRDTKLAEMQAKHTPQEGSTREVMYIRELGEAVGYPYIEVGSHQGFTPAMELIYVRSLALREEIRPLKAIVARDLRLWADNTHWSLASLVKYGVDTPLISLPHYFVDLRMEVPRVANRPESLLGAKLKLAVANAWALQERLERGWRPKEVSFTMRQLFDLGGYSRLVTSR